MSDALYIIAKAPRVGYAKTRLGRAIGHEQAVLLYRGFLQDLGSRFRKDVPFEVGWYVTPRDGWAEISALAGEAGRVLFQGEGDLNERQRKLFRGAAARGEERTVLIASDSPHLEVEVVERAFRCLDRHDVVFGPTHDGGYYLIGMRSQGPYDALRGTTMSRSTVLDEVVARALRSGFSVELLEATFDVDVAEDLRHLRPLVLERPDLPATRNALEATGLLEPQPAEEDDLLASGDQA